MRKTISESACKTLLEKHKGDAVAAIKEAFKMGANTGVMKVTYKEGKK